VGNEVESQLHDTSQWSDKVSDETSREAQFLRELAGMSPEQLLAAADPGLRAVLLRHLGSEVDAKPSNGRFASFISPEL
jgi:hypothetical protein